MLERGTAFGLDYPETKERAFSTVRKGVLAKRKHLSQDYLTYYQYFRDNLAFYVICREHDNQALIKTVIIEQGRE